VCGAEWVSGSNLLEFEVTSDMNATRVAGAIVIYVRCASRSTWIRLGLWKTQPEPKLVSSRPVSLVMMEIMYLHGLVHEKSRL